MRLSDLVNSISEFRQAIASPDFKSDHMASDVAGITADSRTVKPGWIFFSHRGSKMDGHDKIDEALSNGAILCVGEKELRIKNYIALKSSRHGQALVAKYFFGDPSEKMIAFGVTGTNGKTSTTYILEHLLNTKNIATAVVGTIDHHLGEKRWPTDMTTPDSILLQGRLLDMQLAGAQALAIEATSHALDQFRCDGISFNAAIFTNLTRDHLDYHKTTEKYFHAKQRLFNELLDESPKQNLVAVVNGDDEWGRKLRISSKANLLTFGKTDQVDLRFVDVEMNINELQFKLESRFGNASFQIPICGEHNVYNVLGAVGAVSGLGLMTLSEASNAMRTFPGVPGRLQKIRTNKEIHVFVDYAHTPDALEKALITLQALKEKKLWTIFGCGGDRDKGKRPLMGKIAAQYSDHVLITSDNPRSEDPEQIIKDIKSGIRGDVESNVDRRAAIGQVLLKAVAGDIVLIAGKGHEKYQTIGSQKLPFDDVKIAEEILR